MDDKAAYKLPADLQSQSQGADNTLGSRAATDLPILAAIRQED